MGVEEARERMDEARQTYEAAAARVKALEVDEGPQYDEAVVAEQEAREAVEEAEAAYNELTTREARLRKRALAYGERVGPEGVYQQAIDGALDDDVAEQLRALRLIEQDRQRMAIEEAAELR